LLLLLINSPAQASTVDSANIITITESADENIHIDWTPGIPNSSILETEREQNFLVGG
jgi:hypothetical protein